MTMKFIQGHRKWRDSIGLNVSISHHFEILPLSAFDPEKSLSSDTTVEIKGHGRFLIHV